MEVRSWRLRSTRRFWRDVQSRFSIGSQLSTRTLMRFERLALGSESKRTSLPPLRVTHPRRFPASSTRTRSQGCERRNRSVAEDLRDEQRIPCTQAFVQARAVLWEGVICRFKAAIHHGDFWASRQCLSSHPILHPSERLRRVYDSLPPLLRTARAPGSVATISAPCPPQRFFLQPAVPDTLRAAARRARSAARRRTARRTLQ